MFTAGVFIVCVVKYAQCEKYTKECCCGSVCCSVCLSVHVVLSAQKNIHISNLAPVPKLSTIVVIGYVDKRKVYIILPSLIFFNLG